MAFHSFRMLDVLEARVFAKERPRRKARGVVTDRLTVRIFYGNWTGQWGNEKLRGLGFRISKMRM